MKKSTLLAVCVTVLLFISSVGSGWGQTNTTTPVLLDNYDGTGDLVYATNAASQWSITGGIYVAGTNALTGPEHSCASYDLTNSIATWSLVKSNQNVWIGYFKILRTTSGWGTSNYGCGTVLACNNADFANSSAAGYALVIENGSPDKVTLVKFSAGIKDGATNLPLNATSIVSVAVDPGTTGFNYMVELLSDGKWKISYITGAQLSDANAVVKASYSGGNATSASADETYSGSTYKYTGWVFAHSTGNTATDKANFDNLGVAQTTATCSDPATQTSNMTFSNIASDQMTVNWSRGATPGDGVIVVAKQGSAPDDPVDGTAYTANAAFGQGTQIGTGTYVVYMGSGTSINVTSLSSTTSYYFKAYEKNCTGTSIMINTNLPASGSQSTTDACSVDPTIQTTVAANTIAVTTASSGGQTITSGANCAITAKGVCWNTSTNPTTANSKTNDGTGTNDFTSSITGLSAQTQYFVRAYATNSFGTAYANEINFRTLSLEPGAHPATFTATATSSSQINLAFSAASTITNADGYIILRRTGGGGNPTITGIVDGIAPNSLSLPSGTTLVTDINSTSATSYNNSGLLQNTQYNYAIFAYNWDGANPETYNYYTAGTFKTASATTQATAVTLPYYQNFEGSTSEWVLEATGTNKWAIGSATNNGGTKSLYISNNGGTNNAYTITTTANTAAYLNVDLTGATAATLSFDWKSMGEIGYDFGEVYLYDGTSTSLISASEEFAGTTVYATKIINLTPYVGSVVQLQFVWVNDGSGGTQPPVAIDNISIVEGALPSLTTASITSITLNSAVSGGDVTNDGGSSISARGVCWNTSGTPTISDSKTIDGSGTGSFVSSISGLSDNTLYYVRAYATNNTGTAYGNAVTFTTSSVSPPVAGAANPVSSTSFTANWSAATGASSYALDVSTSETFGTTNSATLTEGFETGLSSSGYVTGNLTLSSGIWAFVDGGLRSTDKNSGTYSCQLKGSTGNATTPSLNNIGTLTFYAKSPSGVTMTIKKIVNSVTTTITTRNITSTWAQYTVNVDDNSSGIKIVFSNGSNYCYIDDVAIGYTNSVPSYVSGYENLNVGNVTSYNVSSNISPATTYYYRLRTIGNNSTSANSGTISVTTALNAPVATAATNITTNSFSANWNGVDGATGYYLDVATDADFLNFVSGFENLDVSNVTTYSIAGLISNTNYYYRVRLYNSNGSSGYSNVISLLTSAAASSTFSGTGSWEDAANWSDGVPGETTNVTIDGKATITDIGECNNCTISSFNAVTVNPGTGLIVNGNLLIQSGGSLISSASELVVTGTKTVQRDITANQWHLVSSPISDAVSGMFSGKYLQKHSESTNEYADITSTTELLVPEKGYAVFSTSAFTASFAGTLNSGSQSFTTTNTNSNGWNLVGNPYPSFIDWNAVAGWTKTNIDGTIYFHVNNTKWATWNGTSSVNGGSRYIAPCQGFFVHASGTGSLDMDNDVRTVFTGPFFKNTEEVVPNLVRLEVSGNGYNDEAVLYLDSKSTNEYDGASDAFKLYGSVDEAAQIYTLGSIPLAINTIPEAVPVTVGLHAGASGTYTIAATEINDLTNVKLEDTKTGIITSLASDSYTFNWEAGENENRFILRFAAVGMEEPQQSISSIYSYDKTAIIDLPANVRGNVYIYNLAGQPVAVKESATGQVRINLSPTGVYVVKVVTDKETLTKKVWIR